MTGFGKATVENKNFSLDVMIKTVNGRFLDIKIHSPKVYSFIEIEIRKQVSQKIWRGHVEIYINRKSFQSPNKVHFNQPLAQKWMDGFNQVSSKLKLAKLTDPSVLLQVPDFFNVDDNLSVSPKEKQALLQSLNKSLEACLQLRKKEGQSLHKDLSSHIKALDSQLSQIKKLRTEVIKELSVKFEKRLEKLNSEVEWDEQRLAQEVAFQLDKTDISEEIQRLETHVKAIKQLIKMSEPIGKKLDFYAQELLREVNTIGSKSHNAKLTQVVVECKSIIEKYREQVQNIE